MTLHATAPSLPPSTPSPVRLQRRGRRVSARRQHLWNAGVPTASHHRRALHLRARSELESAGWAARDIIAAVQQKVLFRAGHGLYATREARPEVIALLQCGMRLTCVSGAALYGLWVPGIWVGRCHGAYRRSPPRDAPAGLAWTRHAVRVWPDGEPVLPLHDCLVHAAGCGGADVLTILLESALHEQVMTAADVARVLASVPAHTARAVGQVSGLSESGTETRVARHLRSRRVSMRQQVRITGVGRVDFLIGGKLIVECDSWAYHSDRAAFHRDRRRDQELLARGYIVVRLTWEQVMLEWEQTRAYLDTIIRRGRHR